MRQEDLAPRSVVGRAVAPRGGFDALIRASHERSHGFGLREGDAPDFTTAVPAVLASALEQNRTLLSHAVPVMETLYQQIVNTHNMVILTDAKGLILHSCGDDDFLQRADKVALRRGVDWSEQRRGTNAIGTALVVGEPSAVHAREHFLHVNHFLTCSCAPVFDPSGSIMGALDISGEHHSFHKHTLALVRMSAQMIENHFFTETFPRAVRIHFHSRPEFIGTLVEGIAAFTPAGIFLSANRSGQFQLGVSLHSPQEHTFSSLFGMSMSSLIDQHRSASMGVISCCIHNGVKVYLRVEYSTPPLFLPPQPVGASQPAASAPVRPAGASSLRYLDTGDAQVSRVVTQLNKVLGKDISILILGETGTGKELLARAIHNDSPRQQNPFVAINCASIPEGLIESELFGYMEGAFTGGRKRGHAGKILSANAGTLFLDEIGDMPLSLQPRLLRVLEERRVTPLGTDKSVPIDIALVCATHCNLRSLLESKTFREDLYYRINGLVVRLPPLRERSDLEAIIQRILLRNNLADVTIDPEVLALFKRYSWPGNVRQLANLLRTAERMVDQDRIVRREHLPDDFLEGLAEFQTKSLSDPSAALGTCSETRNLEVLEWRAIRETLDLHKGNVSAAARALGISRNTIYRRLMMQKRA
jgi:transcriptional regulator of acetoin/glycerol metabolism